MELKIISPQESGFIKEITFNHEELKNEIAAKMQDYKTLVFTEETIKDAKVDRANLRKLKDAIEDERKRIKKLCNEPYLAFEKKVKEITSLIDEPIQIIDAQIKEVEEKKKAEKREQIEEIFNQYDFGFELPLEKIFSDKWLNASTSLKSITDEIEAYWHDIKQDLETLGNLPEFGFEAQECYKDTLNMNSAIALAKRMAEVQKAKEEAEKKKEEIPAIQPVYAVPQQITKAPEEEQIIELSFICRGTKEQLMNLKKFMQDTGMEFRPV